MLRLISLVCVFVVLFFKQKTAYEMRISDWSSDVCSSDLVSVALVGDSHAYQLLSTFQRIADREGWRLKTFFKGACPWSTTPLSTPGAFGEACTQWREGVSAQLEQADIDAVFTAALATTPFASAGHDSSYDAAVAGYREAWSTLTDRGIPLDRKRTSLNSSH